MSIAFAQQRTTGGQTGLQEIVASNAGIHMRWERQPESRLTTSPLGLIEERFSGPPLQIQPLIPSGNNVIATQDSHGIPAAAIHGLCLCLTNNYTRQPHPRTSGQYAAAPAFDKLIISGSAANNNILHIESLAHPASSSGCAFLLPCLHCVKDCNPEARQYPPGSGMCIRACNAWNRLAAGATRAYCDAPETFRVK